MANITMTKTNIEESIPEVKETITNFNIAPANGLEILSEKSEEIQSKCSDTLLKEVSLKTMALYCLPHSSKVNAKYKESDTALVKKKTFSDYAFSQFCTKMGVPAQYILKCMKKGYDELAGQNLNTWVDDYNGSLLIREYEDKIRGVLSARYSPFDTPQILDVLSKTTRGMNLKLKGYFMNEERFHARLIQSEPMSVSGEDLFGGIVIDSSDVGRSALSVNFFIYKQICTNGLCISKGSGSLFHQKHLNICTDDFKEELSASIKLIPELIKEYEDIICETRRSNSIVTVGRTDLSDIIMENLDNADERNKKVQELIDRLKSKTKLQDEGVEKVLRVANEKYSFNNWGIINAITEVAQDYTLEKRIGLEKAAANMLRAV